MVATVCLFGGNAGIELADFVDVSYMRRVMIIREKY